GGNWPVAGCPADVASASRQGCLQKVRSEDVSAVITIAVSFVIRALLVAANTTACPEPQVPQGPWTGTALHRAIQHNDVKAARRLMNAATVNERDSLGNTPLVAALTPSVLLEPAGIVGARQRRAQIESESRARQAIAFSLLTKGASAT